MPVHVRERFLNDAEDGRFRISRQASEILAEGHFHANPAALLETRGEPAQRGIEPGLFEQQRMQQVGNRAHLLNGVVGQLAGRAQKFPAGGIFLRKRQVQAPQRHFERGHALRRGLVQIARHAPLLFVAQGQKLPREAPQAFLRAPALGDVQRNAREAHDAPFRVANGNAARVQHALAAIRQREREVVLECFAAGERGLHVAAPDVHVLRPHAAPYLVGRNARSLAFNSLDAVKIVGPERRLQIRAQLPAAHAREPLCLRQQRLAFLQLQLRLLALGDVVGYARHAHHAPFRVANGNSARVQRANAAIPQPELAIVLEGFAAAEALLHEFARLRGLIRGHSLQHALDRHRPFLRSEFEYAKKIIGPAGGVGVLSQFPASHFRQLLRLRQQGLAFAQLLLRRFLPGDVARNSDHANHASFRVANGNAARVQNALAAVRPWDPHVVLEGFAARHGILQVSPHLGDVAWTHSPPGLFQQNRTFPRNGPQNGIQVVGPEDLFQVRVQFPASHVRQLLCLHQQGLALAQLLLRRFLLGDVARNSDHANHASSRVTNGNAARMQNPLAAILQREPEVVLKWSAVCERGLHVPAHPHRVIRSHALLYALHRDRKFARIGAQDAVEIFGPKSGLRIRVQFPASHVRELFRLRQQRFALAQLFFGLFSRSDVAHQQVHRFRFPALARHGGDPRLKPVRPIGHFGGEFDVLAFAAGDHLAEYPAEGAKCVFGQNLQRVPLQKFSAPAVQHRRIRAPQVQEFALGVQLEQEFVEGFYQRGQKMPRRGQEPFCRTSGSGARALRGYLGRHACRIRRRNWVSPA